MNCPRCGEEVFSSGKEWRYGKFVVEKYVCKGCKKAINVYYKDGQISHMIPSSSFVLKRTKILNYLLHHELTTEKEISKKLNLPLKEVEDILMKLERAGRAETKIIKKHYVIKD